MKQKPKIIPISYAAEILIRKRREELFKKVRPIINDRDSKRIMEERKW